MKLFPSKTASLIIGLLAALFCGVAGNALAQQRPPDDTINTPGALPVPTAEEAAKAHALKIPRAAIASSGAIEWDTAKRRYRVARGVTLTGTGLETFEQRFNALHKLTAGRRLQEAENFGDALARYADIIRNNPATAVSCEAHFRSGEIYFKRRQFSEAFDNLNVVIRQHPEFPQYNTVIELQYQVALAIKNGERPRLWGWMPWFKDNSRGLDYFEQVNRNAPHGVRADRALFDKGGFALDLGDKTNDAVDAFERIIYNYPSSPLVPESYLLLAKTHEDSITGHEWDQSATRNALFFYSEFVSRYPTHERAQEAVESVARMRETLARNRYDLGLFYYEHRNNARAAAVFFNEAINAAPASKTARAARARIAEINAGRLADRGVMDWVFGRYPVTRDASYIDASSQEDLGKMGFAKEK
jgi:outer membrane protein assembly factor BamD